MSSKSSNKQTTQQQTTAQRTMDPRLDPYFMNLASATNTAMNSVDRSPWTGPALAGVNSFDNRAVLGMDQMLSALGAQMTPGVFTDNAMKSARGDYLLPGSNPTLQGNINAAINPITERLTRQVLPGLDNASIMDNAFGGDRAQLMKGQAYGDWAQAAGDISAQMTADNYNRERAYQVGAGDQYLSGLNAELAPMQMLAALGDRQRQLDQMGIDDQLMRRMLSEQFAFAGLGPAAQILGTLPYGGETSSSSGTSTSTQTTKQNPLTSLVQGGLGVASMLSGLGWMPFASGAAGAMGAAGGANIGKSVMGNLASPNPLLTGITPQMLAPTQRFTYG